MFYLVFLSDCRSVLKVGAFPKIQRARWRETMRALDKLKSYGMEDEPTRKSGRHTLEDVSLLCPFLWKRDESSMTWGQEGKRFFTFFQKICPRRAAGGSIALESGAG